MPNTINMNIEHKATIDWLLEPENPSVRYLTLTRLFGRSERNPKVREARSAIMRSGTVPAILDSQERSGYWGKPDSFYTAKYRGTVWQLITLAEHCADGRDQRIQRACEFLLENSQDPQSGGFSQKRAKRTFGGLPSEVIPCLTGNLVWSLQQLGYANDKRVAHGVDWLTRFLRFDDGNSAPPGDFPYTRWEMCYGRHSCLMGIVKGLKALSAIPPAKRSKQIQHTLRKAVEFFLHHRVYKRSHNPARVAKPGWTRFGFPRMYQTDALEITHLLVGLGVRDERLREAIALIRSKRQSDNRWLLQDTFNGKYWVDIERKGSPSKWITLKALCVLRDCGEL